MLVCAVALCFAYADPPIPEVMGHNLDPGFLNSLMGNVPEGLELDPYHDSESVYLNATLLGVFPSVEDRIPADPGPSGHVILWTWGEDYSTHIYRDFEVDNRTCKDVGLVINPEKITYSFRIIVNNVSSAHYAVPPSEIPPLGFAFPLDRGQLEQFNATEMLEIRLEYSGSYTYGNAHGCEGPVWYTIEIYEHSTLHYYVENGNVVFFTARPVLGEQWFRNNKFDNLIFSKKKFYKSEIYLDGNKTGEAGIYNFSIYEGAGGAWFINTTREDKYRNATLEEYGLVYEPVPMLRENESFRYLYEQNYSYGGFGYHNLSLVLTDHFLNRYEYNRTLLSRASGEAEAREEGAYTVQGNHTTYHARPTYKEAEPELQLVLIPTGALAIIFIVVAASGWWSTTKAKRA